MIPPLSEHGQLAAVLMKHLRDAFMNDAMIAAQWRKLNFSAPPDFPRALGEYDRFIEIVAGTGCEILWLPVSDGAHSTPSIRATQLSRAAGVILASMGKRSRASEPEAQAEELGGRVDDRRLDRTPGISRAAISSGSITKRSRSGKAPAPMPKASGS